MNISIFSQCLLFIFSLIAFMAFIGLSLFKNRLRYCFILNAAWFSQKSRPGGLTSSKRDNKTDANICFSSPFINDVFYFHQLEIKVDSFSHFFNFDTILNAIETVFQIMKGSDLSTIQLITSIKGFDDKTKNGNSFFWPYIVMVLFLGLLIDAFVFSIISELIDFALVSIWTQNFIAQSI